MKVDWIRIGFVFQGFWKQLLQGVVIFTLDIGSYQHQSTSDQK